MVDNFAYTPEKKLAYKQALRQQKVRNEQKLVNSEEYKDLYKRVVPSIRTKDGKIHNGRRGELHWDVAEKNGLATKDGGYRGERGFTDPTTGKFHTKVPIDAADIDS